MEMIVVQYKTTKQQEVTGVAIYKSSFEVVHRTFIIKGFSSDNQSIHRIWNLVLMQMDRYVYEESGLFSKQKPTTRNDWQSRGFSGKI